MLRRLQPLLREDKQVLVSQSLAVEKHSIKLGTLITALFCDLSSEKQVRIPAQGEKRERDLRDLIKKSTRPVALFIDEAHDLHPHTLIGLKRLLEVVESGGGRLSVVLAGHPKLRNDLRRPSLEEIGYRTDVFTLDGIAGSQREYLLWLLGTCVQQGKTPDSILAPAAIDLLATKLRTPLQIQMHLALALEAGYQTGETPVSSELVDAVLSKHLDDLEPTLARHGYRLRDLVEQFNVKPAEVKAWFGNQLEPTRAAELRDRLLAAGLPI
jgi:type II secretory pathway predicted ATPase ExeA